MTATDDFPVPDYANLLRLDGKAFVVAGAGMGIEHPWSLTQIAKAALARSSDSN